LGLHDRKNPGYVEDGVSRVSQLSEDFSRGVLLNRLKRDHTVKNKT
jgi:hypothetical protein